MIVVDTNVLSELAKRRPDPRVVRWFEETGPDGLYITAVTVTEMLTAATAIAVEADAIATRDKDFTDVGIPVLNPWAA